MVFREEGALGYGYFEKGCLCVLCHEYKTIVIALIFRKALISSCHNEATFHRLKTLRSFASGCWKCFSTSFTFKVRKVVCEEFLNRVSVEHIRSSIVWVLFS